MKAIDDPLRFSHWLVSGICHCPSFSPKIGDVCFSHDDQLGGSYIVTCEVEGVWSEPILFSYSQQENEPNPIKDEILEIINWHAGRGNISQSSLDIISDIRDVLEPKITPVLTPVACVYYEEGEK